MKNNRLISAIALCMVVFVTCSLATTISFDKNGFAISADKNSNVLTVTSRASANEPKEIALHAIVYSDKELKNEVKITDVEIKANRIDYDIDVADSVNEVYVKPPVLFGFQKIDELSVNLKATERANNLFAVTGYEVKEVNGKEVMFVNIIPTGDGATLPRLPKLFVNNISIDGSSSISMDETAHFVNGVFTFELPDTYNGNEALELVISDSIVREETAVQKVVID